MAEAWAAIGEIETEPTSANETAEVWLGSVGYENHPDSARFASFVANSGVDRLIDVRELPLSRRRGYSKTALSERLAHEGIEYVHMRGLGNPKELRDIYKSGRPDEGRRLYSAFLREHRRDDLSELARILGEKRTALMCWEHDPAVCHRTVIIEALQELEGISLTLVDLAE